MTDPPIAHTLPPAHWLISSELHNCWPYWMRSIPTTGSIAVLKSKFPVLKFHYSCSNLSTDGLALMKMGTIFVDCIELLFGLMSLI